MEWKPQGKTYRKIQKRWIDVVGEDLKSLGVENWRNVVQDRDKLRSVIMTAKTLKVMLIEKEENELQNNMLACICNMSKFGIQILIK